jgi:uncharacterized membrane protein
MRPLFLLLLVVLAAARSLASGIQSPSKRGVLPTMTAETEYKFLLIAICCLSSLLVTLYLMTRFPALGVTIAKLNQF